MRITVPTTSDKNPSSCPSHSRSGCVRRALPHAVSTRKEGVIPRGQHDRMSTIDEVIAELSVRQHGLIARRQLDVDEHALSRRLNSGVLTKVSDTVLAVAGAPRTDKQR